jgi:hypothetical protein
MNDIREDIRKKAERIMSEEGKLSCTQCKRILGLDCFHVDSRRNSVRQPCRECFRAKERLRRSQPAAKELERKYKVAHREEHRKHTRRYRKAHAGSETEQTRKWTAKNPEKRRAHAKVWNALKRGLLTKLPCSVCGEERAQAHHDDYSRPLDVRWLCSVHHADVHAAIRSDKTETP